MFFPHREKARAGPAGAGLAAGFLVGIAAGLLIRSETGRRLGGRAKTLAEHARHRLSRRFKKARTLTRAAYEDLVDDIVERYEETRELAADQADALREDLLEQWDALRAHLDRAGGDARE